MEIHHLLHIHLTNEIYTVYQVHWLKAKAQRDHWVEEVKILHHEMEFYVNFMNHQEEQWEDETAEATHKGQTGSGLHCYTLRQRDVVQAWQEFNNVQQKYPPKAS